MRSGKIEFTGRTMGDVLAAIDAAMDSIEAENTMGFGNNEDGSFKFEVDVEEDS